MSNQNFVLHILEGQTLLHLHMNDLKQKTIKFRGEIHYVNLVFGLWYLINSKFYITFGTKPAQQKKC